MHRPPYHRAHLQLLHHAVDGVEPTVQEPSVPEAEFRTTLDPRFSGVNVRIYLVVSMIVAVLLGGLMLWSELGHLKNGLVNLKSDAGAIKEQLANLQSRLRWLDDTLDRNSAETVRAIREATIGSDRKLSSPNAPDRISFVAMTLSISDREIIRKFFDLRRQPDVPSFDAKVGDIAPEKTPLYPVPDELSKALPALKGYRFFPDQADGTIILVRPLDNRVVAIV
jgi:hypothetical protein